MLSERTYRKIGWSCLFLIVGLSLMFQIHDMNISDAEKIGLYVLTVALELIGINALSKEA